MAEMAGRAGRTGSDRLRICVIASSRFPVAEPFAGGLEAHTHALVAELRRRGHAVQLFAAPGSDAALQAEALPVAPFASSETARADLAAPPEAWMQEHHAYLDLMLALQRDAGRFDLIHNNSLHHLPVAMSGVVTAPVVTTLHTPPLPWLESAVALARGRCAFVAVSEATARQWRPCVDAEVVHNGIDVDRWRTGPGGDRAVWSGRLVPEKAPHLAIRAARRAGIGLDLVGPVGDPRYVATEVRPLLDPEGSSAPDAVRYLGHLDQHALSALVGRAAVAVVTPAWEEPFGLVAAEAMACGTPVAALARGAMPELITPVTGRLARPADPADDRGDRDGSAGPGATDRLATAIREAVRLDRTAVRRHAVAAFSLGAMVDAYERVYARMVGDVDRVA